MAFTKKWGAPTGTKAYYAWRSMRSRCTNKNNPSWKHYGGRGIAVCSQWAEDYDAFFRDMGNPPTEKHSLDRVDNNAGYSPTNCRWATPKEQLNNQRRNRLIAHSGETNTLSKWSEKLGVTTDALYRRLERGLALEKAFHPGHLNTWEHGTRAGYESHGCRCEACKESNNLRHKLRRAARKEGRNAIHA